MIHVWRLLYQAGCAEMNLKLKAVYMKTININEIDIQMYQDCTQVKKYCNGTFRKWSAEGQK